MKSKIRDFSKKRWEGPIEEALKSFAKAVFYKRGSAEEAADAMDMSLSGMRKMAYTASGTIESWIRLYGHGSGMTEEQFENFLKNPKDFFIRLAVPGPMGALVSEFISKCDPNKAALAMKVAINAQQLEEVLGVSVSIKNKIDNSTKKVRKKKRSVTQSQE